MLRFLISAALLALPVNALAQQTTDERVKTLETEIRQLREELQALRQRVQALEPAAAAPAAPATRTPPSTQDPGANPWGNPDAIRRTLGQALRENLQSRGIPVLEPGADAKTAATYRNEVTRWWNDSLRTKRFRQSVNWPIEVLEAAVVTNSGTREYDITAHALNEDGARVGRWFVIRCPASAVPNLNPLQAAGRWTLRAEVQPEVMVVGEGGQSPNVFRARETIAPQVECSLRFSVAGLDPATAATPEPAASKGRGAR